MQNAKFKMQTFRAMRHLHFPFCSLHFVVLTACRQPPAPIHVSHSGGTYEAALATDEKGFAVAWYDTRDGNAEIYIRLLDGNSRLSGPERRLTGGNTWSILPAIRSWRAGFAPARTEYQPTSSESHEGPGEVAFAVVD